MPTILFAWELGNHWGHLSRDLAVAQSLRAAGHRVHLAVRDSCVAFEVLTQAGFAFTQAPLALHTAKLPLPPANYAEMLLLSGYADRVTLFGLVQGWLGLLDVIRPTTFCIDHAPTALLAARIRGVPVVVMGSGFEIPPNADPFPSIRPWEIITDSRLQHANQVVLATINSVLSAHRSPVMDRLADLFAHPKALTTYAELDHYGARSDHLYVGPITTLPQVPVVEWKKEARQRVFGYLRPNPSMEMLLSALRNIDADVVCAIPGITRTLQERFASSQLRLFPHAVQLQPLLASANLVVSYGGAGTVANALLAGVPLLIVPQTVEQYLGALRVEELGAGIVVQQQRGVSDFTNAVRLLLTGRNYAEAANAFAHRHASYNNEKAIEEVTTLLSAARA